MSTTNEPLEMVPVTDEDVQRLLDEIDAVLLPREPTEEKISEIIQAMRFTGDWRETAKNVYKVAIE